MVFIIIICLSRANLLIYCSQCRIQLGYLAVGPTKIYYLLLFLFIIIIIIYYYYYYYFYYYYYYYYVAGEGIPGEPEVPGAAGGGGGQQQRGGGGRDRG